jgi:DNA-binding HxlR family transcriptional regulator
LSGSTANASGTTSRSGAQALTLLASPLNLQILGALGDGPKQLVDLRRACGMAPQTTLRTQLKKLHGVGAIERPRQDRSPGTDEHGLSDAGRELLAVATVLERWLAGSPDGPLEPGGSAAKAAIGALVEGWSTCMLRALAARPLTLTELDAVISSMNYPSLERRLSAMRLVGEVEARSGDGRRTPYAISPWGRTAVAPLVVAARWERRHMPDRATPVGKIDAEATFLMAMPLLRLPADLSGTCRMAADLPGNGRSHDLAGVMVEARDGGVVSCTTRLEGYPDAWASGSVAAWLCALIDGDNTDLELGGNSSLARGLLDGLRNDLPFQPSSEPT